MKMSILARFKNRKKHKVVFRLESNNKKFCTIKLTNEEFLLITQASKVLNVTIEQFFMDALNNKIKK